MLRDPNGTEAKLLIKPARDLVVGSYLQPRPFRALVARSFDGSLHQGPSDPTVAVVGMDHDVADEASLPVAGIGMAYGEIPDDVSILNPNETRCLEGSTRYRSSQGAGLVDPAHLMQHLPAMRVQLLTKSRLDKVQDSGHIPRGVEGPDVCAW